MKTIYNIKTLCVVLFCGAGMTVHAQEPQENALNREMTLEREYDPSVQDANKVNTLPVVKEPEVKKMPIDYASYHVAADPQKEIFLLPSGRIMTDMIYNKRRGYLNLGGGTHLNLNGDVGYHILSTEKDQLNLFFSHRSSNGNVKYLQGDKEKVKAKLNDNLGGINYRHAFNQAALTLGANYGYTRFNYYGYSPRPTSDLSLPTVPRPDVDTNQGNQFINIYGGVKSSEDVSLGYWVDLDYKNFSHKYAYSVNDEGITENAIRAKAGLFSSFSGNQQIGVGGQVNYYTYLEGALPEAFENYAEITLTPYYKVTGDNWNVKLGANVMFITGDDSKVFVSPDIAADIEVADKTVLYLTADGRIESNSAYELSRMNRYVNPTFAATPSRTWLDATIGLKSGVVPGFWFTVFGGYKITDNDIFFTQTPAIVGTTGDYWGNVSNPFGMNSKVFRIGAEVKYAYQKFLDFYLKGVYNSWSLEYGDLEPYGKPDLEIKAGVEIRPVEKVSFALDYYLAGGRYAVYSEQLVSSTRTEVKLDNINELNLTGTYTFNDTFGAYIKLNNLLFQKYELQYGYPVQGFNAMIGVNINF